MEDGMKTNLRLKMRILERYRTQARFAAACGKKENWISRIICGRDVPTQQDMELFKRKLDVDESFFE
jgi:transcriptional regulator with XRE-family HTH domain